MTSRVSRSKKSKHPGGTSMVFTLTHFLPPGIDSLVDDIRPTSGADVGLVGLARRQPWSCPIRQGVDVAVACRVPVWDAPRLAPGAGAGWAERVVLCTVAFVDGIERCFADASTPWLILVGLIVVPQVA